MHHWFSQVLSLRITLLLISLVDWLLDSDLKQFSKFIFFIISSFIISYENI